MKNFLLTISFFLISAISLFPQWQVLNEGYNLYSIDFINDQTGWIACYDGKILKTTNEGISWKVLSINDNWYINNSNFINESTGWAVGNIESRGIIIKTVDGGTNWSIKQEIPETWLNILEVVDENNVYAAAADKIFRTSDGGDSWNIVTPQTDTSRYFYTLWFANPDTGLAIGNYYNGTSQISCFFRTTNGGKNWKETQYKDFYLISDLSVLNDSTAFFKSYSDTTVFLQKTEDMFYTWKVILKTNYTLGNYHFLNNDTGYAITNKIIKTTDGGSNWTTLPSPKINSRLPLNKIYFTNAGTGFIISNFGCLFRTTDESNWQLSLNGYPFKGSKFFDKNKGILFGGFFAGIHEMFPSGDLFLTEDGGKSYNVIFSEFDLFSDFEIVNDSIMFTTGKSIYKSIDGGKNWVKKYTARSDSANPIFGADLNTINDLELTNKNGWAAGRIWDSVAKSGGAIILKTTDTGENWSPAWQMFDLPQQWHYLNSVYTKGNSGWAVGHPSLIVKYTDAAGWVTQKSISNLPLNKVFSISNHVWISGGYSADQNIFIKSTDNGFTWKPFNNLPYIIRDMYFFNENFGWAVGSNTEYEGVILKTVNGGDTWEVNVENLTSQLISINVKDNYAWAVGNSGMIVRSTDAGLTWIVDNDNVHPNKFFLEQNYPNPFNPETIITWHLPAASRVSVKIYDALGKQVAELVNEEQPAGIHRIAFNAVNLSSGIYYCRLKAGEFTSSRKMLLIK